MSRRIKFMFTASLIGVAVIIGGYLVWNQRITPQISYHNMLYLKTKTLTLSEFQSQIGTEFIPLGRSIHGHRAYIPAMKFQTGQLVSSYLVGEIVLQESNDRFVVYNLKQ